MTTILLQITDFVLPLNDKLAIHVLTDFVVLPNDELHLHVLTGFILPHIVTTVL